MSWYARIGHKGINTPVGVKVRPAQTYDKDAQQNILRTKLRRRQLSLPYKARSLDGNRFHRFREYAVCASQGRETHSRIWEDAINCYYECVGTGRAPEASTRTA